MKPLSDKSKKLLDDLHKIPWPRNLFEKIGANDSSLLQIITKLSETSEILVAKHLAYFLDHPNKVVIDATAKALHQLLSNASPQEFVCLDSLIRQTSHYGGGGWYNLKPDKVKSLAKLEPSIYALGLVSLHQSGYVREEAIRYINKINTGEELSFLLIRFNDWVPSIREIAYEFVKSRLNHGYTKTFLKNIVLLYKLKDSRRHAYSELIDGAFNLLKAPEASDILIEALKSKDTFIRRSAFKIITETKADPNIVAQEGLKQKDHIIRFWVVDNVLPKLAKDDHYKAVTQIKKDPFMPIRREALFIIATRYPQIASEELKKALLDNHMAIRESARNYLSKIEDINYAEVYRAFLVSDDLRILKVAILGLGETGAIEDSLSIAPFVSRKESPIRRAVIRSLAKLDANSFGDLFYETLTDERRGISSEARKVFVKNLKLVNLAKLLAIFNESFFVHVRKNILILIDKLGKWDKVPPFIMASSDSNCEVSELSSRYLTKWLASYNASFETPTQSQINEIVKSIDKFGSNLDEGFKKQLVFSLKGFQVPD